MTSPEACTGTALADAITVGVLTLAFFGFLVFALWLAQIVRLGQLQNDLKVEMFKDDLRRIGRGEK